MNENFLAILKAALLGEPVSGMENIPPEEWEKIFALAEIHNVLPMIYETVYRLPAIKEGKCAAFTGSSRMVRYLVAMQTVKTQEFLQLNQRLQDAGIQPLVVKGLICRNLYPMSDHRISSDEDVLIPEEQFEACHRVIQEFGLQTEADEDELKSSYEISYRGQGSALFIELHKQLFPSGSEVFSDWNRFFEGAFERSVQENIQDSPVFTLGYTDHLFYLICHAFKHFLHSGFGIRQVCDIIMYANAYGGRADWKTIYDNCCEIHGEVFAAALFQIGEKYLGFDPEKASYPYYWRDIQVDETAMLEDLLDGGVYGNSTMSRKHSSNMTLDAVSADKKGKKAASSVWGSLFPPAKKLRGRYPWLRRHPYLLPFAWADRIVKYRKETASSSDNNAVKTMKIGNQRVELLRYYGVIK